MGRGGRGNGGGDLEAEGRAWREQDDEDPGKSLGGVLWHTKQQRGHKRYRQKKKQSGTESRGHGGSSSIHKPAPRPLSLTFPPSHVQIYTPSTFIWKDTKSKTHASVGWVLKCECVHVCVCAAPGSVQCACTASVRTLCPTPPPPAQGTGHAPTVTALAPAAFNTVCLMLLFSVWGCSSAWTQVFGEGSVDRT